MREEEEEEEGEEREEEEEEAGETRPGLVIICNITSFTVCVN